MKLENMLRRPSQIAAALTVANGHRANWYRIENRADDGRATVHLYDEIGFWGTTASEFIEEISALEVEAIDVRISSSGGDVFDGIAIYNALRAHDATVTTIVDGAALSIASVIAQAGAVRQMMSGSQMMIHEAWGLALGNAGDLREYADLLDFQTENIAEIYAERSGGTGRKAHYLKLMREETWLSAKDAVSEGLADRVVKVKAAAATVAADDDADDDEDEVQDSTETAAIAEARERFAASIRTELYV